MSGSEERKSECNRAGETTTSDLPSPLSFSHIAKTISPKVVLFSSFDLVEEEGFEMRIKLQEGRGKVRMNVSRELPLNQAREKSVKADCSLMVEFRGY